METEKLSRTEKSAKKALSKLDLEKVDGFSTVTMQRGKLLFIVNKPDVYINGETYVVFGKTQIKNLDEKSENDVDLSEFQTEETKEIKEEKDEPEEVEEEIDDSVCNPEDIELVMQQANVTKNQAVKALIKNNFDMVDAIMELTT